MSATKDYYVGSLIDQTTNVLQSHNHPNPNGWKNYLSQPLPTNNSTIEMELQIVRNAMMVLLEDAVIHNQRLDTLQERFVVQSITDPNDWVRLFKLGVAPCLIKNQLPYPMT